MPWRQGTKVPINVYNSADKPVCQCQTPESAELIVKAVNAYLHQTGSDDESGTDCPDCGLGMIRRGTFPAGDPRLAGPVLLQCPCCKAVTLDR